MVKTCKLPYLVDKAHSDFPLHKIHCDLWCMAPITSVQIFWYYVSFIYTWMYTLRYKSIVFDWFQRFKKLVELQHEHKIRALQSDEVGGFGKLEFSKYLSNHCIIIQCLVLEIYLILQEIPPYSRIKGVSLYRIMVKYQVCVLKHSPRQCFW